MLIVGSQFSKRGEIKRHEERRNKEERIELWFGDQADRGEDILIDCFTAG